jgi:hypothetical protein
MLEPVLNAKGVSRRGTILPLRVQNGPNNQKFLFNQWLAPVMRCLATCAQGRTRILGTDSS